MKLIVLLFVAASCSSETSSKVAVAKNVYGQVMQRLPETVDTQGVASHDAAEITDDSVVDSQKSASSVMAEAMARRMVHNNLLMVSSQIAKRRSENFLKAGDHLQGFPSDWLVVLLLVFLFIVIMLFLYLISSQANDNPKMVVSGRPVGSDPFLDPSKPAAGRPSLDPSQQVPGRPSLDPSQQVPGRPSLDPSQQGSVPTIDPSQGTGTQGSLGYPSQQGIGTQGSLGSNTAPPAEKPLGSGSLGSGALPQTGRFGSPLQSTVLVAQAAWRTTPGVPPALCPNEVPPQVRKSYRVAVASLRRLYARAAIEITSEFDYPQYYARLGAGPEGGRLEIAAEPSWGYLVATLGRLEYPAALSKDAMLHGPDREYYGPFQRYSGGFCVGHWSKGGTPIVTLMPRKNYTGGFVVDIKSGAAQIAHVEAIDNGQRYQIDIQPGIDNVLIISLVLASFVASQPMIDENGTRV